MGLKKLGLVTAPAFQAFRPVRCAIPKIGERSVAMAALLTAWSL
jgi:hypothetical protein